MNDLEEIIVTVARGLKLNEFTAEMPRDEIIALSLAVGEKLLKSGYSKGRKEYVDIFDEEWQEKIYEYVFLESRPTNESSETTESAAEPIEQQEPDEIQESINDYGYSDDELDDLDEAAPDVLELLEAPAAPKIKHAERAERKALDPLAAELNAPSWAKR